MNEHKDKDKDEIGVVAGTAIGIGCFIIWILPTVLLCGAIMYACSD
jgi:hypothetical protein